MSHAQQYYENYGGEAVADYVERHLRGSPTEAARLRAMAERLPAGATTVLDVGAGHGLLLEELKARRGIAGVGIEITEAKVAYARSRGVDLRLGDASHLPFADAAFDCVVCCEVLEHLPCGIYESALAELVRVAGRWVMLSVPYDERRHFVRCPYCGASVNPNYHFRSFDAAAMQGLLPGFRLVRTEGLGHEAHGWLKQWLRPWLSRAWPSLLVCPSCGWKPAQAPGAPAAAAGSLAQSRWANLLPSPSRPLWRVALYQRAGTPG